MGAEFFSVEPKPTGGAGRARIAERLRQLHRWMSIVFTLRVVANFVGLAAGQVPAAITYAPLPPLLILTLSGLYMFGRHAGAKRHATMLATKG